MSNVKSCGVWCLIIWSSFNIFLLLNSASPPPPSPPPSFAQPLSVGPLWTFFNDFKWLWMNPHTEKRKSVLGLRNCPFLSLITVYPNGKWSYLHLKEKSKELGPGMGDSYNVSLNSLTISTQKKGKSLRLAKLMIY